MAAGCRTVCRHHPHGRPIRHSRCPQDRYDRNSFRRWALRHGELWLFQPWLSAGCGGGSFRSGYKQTPGCDLAVKPRSGCVSVNFMSVPPSIFIYLERADCPRGWSLVSLPKLFARAVLVKELREQALPSAHAQRSLQFPRGIPARTSREARGLDAGRAVGPDRDLDLLGHRVRHAAPPTFTVTRIEPSSSLVSATR